MIDIVTLYLILALITTSACEESDDEEINKSLNKSEQDLKESLLFLIKE